MLQTRTDNLKYDETAGVLLAPRERIIPDPNQPRTYFEPTAIQELQRDISSWRDAGRGLAKTGIITPISCRWEVGAFDSNGNVKPDAKLILIDGERRWRASEGVADWLPLVLDDMPSEDAHDAALRTNIHKKMLLPLEEAAAFQNKREKTGWGVGKLARHYNISEGYVKNRIYLLECTKDVQEMVSQEPDTLSHALAFRAAGNKLSAQDRKDLIEKVLLGMSFVDLKAAIERNVEDHQRSKSTFRAPDLQTQQRQQIAQTTGSAPMNRGERVMGASPRESAQNAVRALRMASAQIDNAATWFRTMDGENYEGKVIPELERLIAKLEMYRK